MTRARRTLLVAGALAGLFVLALVYLRGAPGRLGATGGQVGQVAPLFTSTDLSGQPVDLKAYRGRPVLLNFWASWCVPCRSEFPVLHQLQERHPEVRVLGVVFQDADNPARTFLRAQAATWPGVRDPGNQIADAYGVHAKPGIPVSILIDASGRVRAVHYGPLLDQASADGFVAGVGV